MPFGWDDAIAIGSSALSFLGQEDTNDANRQISQQQMDFQERMSNTAHQREVKDLIAAGLNPMLSAKLGGASTPPGSQAVMQNSAAVAADTYAKSQAARVAQADVDVKKATADNIRADTRVKLEGSLPELIQRATTGQFSAANLNAATSTLLKQGRKIDEEVENLKAQRDKIRSETDRVRFEVERIQPLEERARKLEIVRQLLENRILKPEADWASRAGEFRPAAKDFGSIVNSGSRLRFLNRR